MKVNDELETFKKLESGNTGQLQRFRRNRMASQTDQGSSTCGGKISYGEDRARCHEAKKVH